MTTFSDGGARGNPGPAAAGFVIFSEDQKLLWEEGVFLGHHLTNNQAEYRALLLALNKAYQRGATEVISCLDSELVVYQLQGRYKVKDKDLKDLVKKVQDLKSLFKKVEFIHVERAKNKRADRLVNQTIDQKLATL